MAYITETINLEMNKPNDLVVVHAVQGERYSREIVANLKRNGATYSISNNAIPLVRYLRPDGHVGFYDYDPVGNRVVTISGAGQITLILAEEMCSVHGRVAAHIDLYDKTTGAKISAFYFYVDVERAASDKAIITKANVSGVQDLIKAILQHVYTPGSSTTGAVIDNTLSIPGAVGDAKAMGDVVLVQPEQPTIDQISNKIWIDTDTETETEVPDMDDFNNLSNAIQARLDTKQDQIPFSLCISDRDDNIKKISVPSITELSVGRFIVVMFANSNNAEHVSIQINDLLAYPVSNPRAIGFGGVILFYYTGSQFVPIVPPVSYTPAQNDSALITSGAVFNALSGLEARIEALEQGSGDIPSDSTFGAP